MEEESDTEENLNNSENDDSDSSQVEDLFDVSPYLQ